MKNSEFVIIVLVAISAILAIGIVTTRPALFSPFDRDVYLEPPPWNILVPYFIIAKAILSIVNSVLLTIVLVIYLEIYRKTGSQFSIGLVIFSIALLLYSFTDNPIIHGFAGFRLSGLGPFTILPDLFTCIASAILLYLSRQ